ncbi:MAG: DNA/RNA non-specific endonuclease [Bryobacterales bacterium]|nr:DNA/RNA non-specific endonuclease [Bryobacterales bacterium]
MSTTSLRVAGKLDEAAELRIITADLAQLVLDITGFVDPTPVSDGLNALISLGRGDWLGAGLSGLSMVPYIGDLAKAGKFPKYLKTIERSIVLAQQSERARRALLPVFQKLDEAMNLMPRGVSGQLDSLRGKIADFLKHHGVARGIARVLPDISRNFTFRSYKHGDDLIKEAGGRLGVPGTVMTHRNEAAQRLISEGIGEDAGHLIGNRFGAPGGVENLSPQNWAQNRFGTFKKLENQWADKLKNGIGIEVNVKDVYKPGETRPWRRIVEWTEIQPNGGRITDRLDFLNTHSTRSRTAQGIESGMPPGHEGKVFDLFTGKRIE